MKVVAHMSGRARAIGSIACNALVALFSIGAVCVSGARRGTSIFWYYTQDSNIFAALVAVAFVVWAVRSRMWARGPEGAMAREPLIPKPLRLLRYCATCGLTITFTVVLFVLAPNPLSGGYRVMFLQGTNVYLHLLSPVLCLLSFALFERPAPQPDAGGGAPGYDGTLSLRDAAFTLVPTLVYAAFLYPANALGVYRGPYPFFLVNEMPLWQSVAWALGLFVAFFLVALLVRRLGQGRSAGAGATSA